MVKRLLVLAVALALFVTAFFIYFHILDVKIDNGFKQEREKFHVDGMILTATPGTIPPAAVPTPAPTAPVAPAPTPAAAPAPAPTEAAPDSQPIIGPVPPPATPDNSSNEPAATPATPAPESSPPSTLIFPGLKHFPLVLLAAVQAPTNAESADVPSTHTATTNSSPAHATHTETAAETNAVPAAKKEGHATTGTSVIVLGYHQFTGPGIGSRNIYSMRQDVFEEEMKYLKDNGYHVVPLADVVRFIKHETTLPPNAVAVTIDDGYKSAIVWAAPVLKKYGYPWTFFIYPDFITVAEGNGAASWNDLLQLQSEGVDIECHSKSHPQLTKKGGKSPEQYDTWLTAESVGAKATLEQHLGKPVKYFAYPYGAYNKQVEEKVVDAGFEAVFTVANNPVHASTDIHAVGRYIITTPVEKAFASYLRQGALGIVEASPAPGATTTEPRPLITAVLGYAGGNLDPRSISADVRDFGEVRHDFDPETSTIKLYLPRDLVQPVVIVNIRAKDAVTGQTMIANWRFNYVSAAVTAAHAAATNTVAHPAPPEEAPETNHAAAHEPATNVASAHATNAASATNSAAVPATNSVATNHPAAALPATNHPAAVPATNSVATNHPAAVMPATNHPAAVPATNHTGTPSVPATNAAAHPSEPVTNHAAATHPSEPATNHPAAAHSPEPATNHAPASSPSTNAASPAAETNEVPATNAPATSPWE